MWNCDSPSALMSMLRTPNSFLKVEASRVLAAASSHPSSFHAVDQLGLIAALLRCLQEENQSVLFASLRALHELLVFTPPLIEFDEDGKFVQGWGGPGEGYDWPEIEHGVYVDARGFVWIGGNGKNDHQLLKFTRDGKFVMQIGKKGQSKGNKDTQNVNQAADTFYYAKTNELIVADGYGNKRIIVFDADTGAFKRMWGAFGNEPLDDVPPPAKVPEASRIPASMETGRGPEQFVRPVHAARVSNDGLIYVSDRGGKRVQVFTLDGKFVSQRFIDRWCEEPHCGNGQTVASTAFSHDPAQRFLYVASRSPQRVWVLDRKTMEPLDSFGRMGIAPGEFYVMHHMNVDAKGNLYVTEVQDGKRVQKFVYKGMVQVPVQ